MTGTEPSPGRWAGLRTMLLRAVRDPRRWFSVRGGLVLLAALVLALPLYALAWVPFTPGISDIRKAKNEVPAQLMSADGKLLAEYRWANREWVTLKQVSPHVIDALIATEDHRFYEHFGLDWRRTASSVVHTLRGDPQGGSTITQQLARNLFPEEIGRSRSLTRKIKEAITALKIEASYTKDEILETYLNTVPFLYNAYGIEMAARTYFDKSAEQLDVLQSATLIGMLKGTAYYNPVLNPERAKARRNIVLSQMVKRGKLDAQQFELLQKRALRVNFERQTEVMGPAPHFAMQLRKQLIEWADSRGYSLYADGLVVRTTIDSRLQNFANQAVARQGRQLQGVADTAWAPAKVWGPDVDLVRTLVRESAKYRSALDKNEDADEALARLLGDAAFLKKLRSDKTRVQAGFLAQDPVTGHVLAWVGSRDFGLDPFDHVQAARRQPGSTFKPFVYGAAFAQGLSPQDTLMDAAVEIPLGGGRVWRPTDGRAPSDAPMTLADGLALSKNTITAQVMQQVGAPRVAELARALGVRQSPLEEVPSLALGTSPVTLKEMVAAYSSITNLGRYVEPVLITRIEDRHGTVLETFAPPPPEVVFDARAAQTLRNTMRGGVDHGTATAIRTRYGIQADVAGKTGTTQDNADGWFILMQPRVVAGAWVGFNDGRITLRSDYWGQGARSALPVVGDFLQQALRAKVIDGRERFFDEFDTRPTEPPPADSSLDTMRDWIRGLFGGAGSPAPTGAGASPSPSTPAAPPIPAQPQWRAPAALPPVTHDDSPPRPASPNPSAAPVPVQSPAAQGGTESWLERMRRRADPLLPPAGPDGNRTTPPGTPVQDLTGQPYPSPRPASPDGSPATR